MQFQAAKATILVNSGPQYTNPRVVVEEHHERPAAELLRFEEREARGC